MKCFKSSDNSDKLKETTLSLQTVFSLIRDQAFCLLRCILAKNINIQWDIHQRRRTKRPVSTNRPQCTAVSPLKHLLLWETTPLWTSGHGRAAFASWMTKISAPTAARCSGRCIRKWEQKNRQQVHQTWGLVTVKAFYFFISERREPAAAQILSADKLIRVHQMFRSSVLYNCDSSAVFLCRETDALGWPRLWGVKDQISNPEC